MTTTAGLFQLDMIDHHAVLGFSLAADPKQVRKRYLKVARKLHPDSLREASEEQRKLASELLSKQVNPAYETLTQDKLAKEHKILLKMKQQQLSANPSLVTVHSEAARALLNAKDIEAAYEAALQTIAATQFDQLSQVESAIGNISELNAVYLMCKESSSGSSQKSTAQAATTAPGGTGLATAGSVGPASANSTPKAMPKRSHADTIIQSYLKRAEEFASQQDYSRGILELREAIASHPKNARCHAELSNLYHRSGQATLAKIHAKQALVFDPDNQTAKAVQARLEKANRKQKANGTKQAKKGKEKGGGLLSGLFGGKKR